MKRWSLVISFLLAGLLPLAAQQISVEEFARLKRPLWRHKAVTVDPDYALMDFVTQEKGFTFLADGKTEAKADEGDKAITVSLPHKTTWITIQHPQFGKTVWKVPDGKSLRRHRHYRAQLFASDPTVDYKATRQWVVFHLTPSNTLLQVDSTLRPVRDAVVEYYLPVGKHSYRVEAPFHEAAEGTFELTDSVRADISVVLQPIYSFLTVKTEWEGGDIYIDNAPVQREDATSYRLMEGYHRVNFYWVDECMFDTLLFVGRSEKKVLTIMKKDLRPRTVKRTDPGRLDAPETLPATEDAPVPVKLIAHDPEAEIWVDREKVGVGTWEGTLSRGFHIAEARKDGLLSTPVRLSLEDSFPQEITLGAPGTGYGLVNIYSNVTGARIRIDGKDYGETPNIIRLEASRSYKVTLSKEGHKTLTRTVAPRGNQQVDLYMELKKK